MIIIGAIFWCLVLEWNTALSPLVQMWFDSFSASVSVICIVYDSGFAQTMTE